MSARHRGERRRQQIAVGVILQQIGVVPPHDRGDLLPPRQRHDRSRRGLQRRHAIEHARAGLGECAIEIFRDQPVRVGGDAVQPIARLRRQREHAGIGVALGQHGIVRCCDHAERDRQRVLSAMGDEELVGIRGDAERGEPGRHRLAMPRQTLVRQIAEQVRHLAVGDDVRQHGRNDVVLAGIGRDIECQIDASPPTRRGRALPAAAVARRYRGRLRLRSIRAVRPPHRPWKWSRR